MPEQGYSILRKTAAPIEGPKGKIGYGLVNPQKALYETFLLHPDKNMRRQAQRFQEWMKVENVNNEI